MGNVDSRDSYIEELEEDLKEQKKRADEYCNLYTTLMNNLPEQGILVHGDIVTNKRAGVLNKKLTKALDKINGSHDAPLNYHGTKRLKKQKEQLTVLLKKYTDETKRNAELENLIKEIEETITKYETPAQIKLLNIPLSERIKNICSVMEQVDKKAEKAESENNQMNGVIANLQGKLEKAEAKLEDANDALATYFGEEREKIIGKWADDDTLAKENLKLRAKLEKVREWYNKHGLHMDTLTAINELEEIIGLGESHKIAEGDE